MASPYLVAAVSISALIALAAISTTSSNQMNWSLTAQQAMKIQADKASEEITLIIKNNTLELTNNAMMASTLKELRVLDGNGILQEKIDFSAHNVGGYILGAFETMLVRPENFSQYDFTDRKIIAITDLGNVFASTSLDATESGGGGKAMINGMGINSRIIQTEHTGKINYGQGIVGIQESLEPYKVVPSTTNFAAEILDSEPSLGVLIPKFNTKFTYRNTTQTLQDVGGTTPNVLGYSQSRGVGGSSSVSNTDGITISGTGTVILKLNDYQGENLVMEGTVPAGATMYIGSNPQYDYLTIPYHATYGYQVWSGGLPTPVYSQNGCSYANGAGYNCNASWTYTRTFSPPLMVSSQSNYNSFYYSASWPFSIQSGTQNPTTYSINSVRMVASVSSGWHSCYGCYPTSPPVPTGQTHFVYDKEIIMQNKIELGGNFQTTFKFEQSKQYYLVAKPNGGTISIRGFIIDPQSTPMLQIDNLQPNTPFQIEKNGKVAVSGMSNYDGKITVYASEFTVNDVSTGGMLRLYPSALSYRGPFSTIVFDNINRQTIHIQTPEEKIYIVHAYVSIPVVGEIKVTDVYLDNHLSLGYLGGNYTTGDKIRIPVIPGYHDINMKINGVPTTTVIANVLGGTGLKVMESTSSTITSYEENAVVSSVSSTAGSTSYVISTKEGTMVASLTATVSAESEIENYAHFGYPPPPPPPPVPRDPLKAYVDVYKNGVLVKQQEIYLNTNPLVQNTAQTVGSSSRVTVKYVYPQTVINGAITVDALPGDMVEFYVHANIQADGPIPPIPSGAVFYHYSGQGHATVTIHGGSILSS
ncbi:MAG: hypothetical protein QW395_05175 [Candidatus Nitrosotenuis sp.]